MLHIYIYDISRLRVNAKLNKSEYILELLDNSKMKRYLKVILLRGGTWGGVVAKALCY